MPKHKKRYLKLHNVADAEKLEAISITSEAFARIMAYTNIADTEVNGYATFNKHVKCIDYVFPLIEQKCTAASCEFTDKGQAEFIYTRGAGKANVWWHTHPGTGAGAVFWSGGDEDGIKELGKTFDTVVSIVFTKDGYCKARLDVFSPIRATIPLALNVVFPALSQEVMDQLEAEVNDKVTHVRHEIVTSNVYKYDSGYGSYIGGYGSAYGDELSNLNLPQERLKWLRENGYKVKDGKLMRIDTQSITGDDDEDNPAHDPSQTKLFD
jgi:hypothetical protein